MTAITTTALGSRLDTALGRLTMYRLVLWVLAVLAGYSLLLNVLGWLTFGLPEMLAHLALCLGLTYASNRALAALFRVRPHTESSLITGLLLYFLFWPSQSDSQGLQLAELAGVALACVLASASKYALAWRGRHIFNPAAAGAFLAGLTGLNIATWWAATPAMLWLVLPGVLLVLYRIRKFADGRRLHRGRRVHRGRGPAPGRDGAVRGPVAAARAASGAVLRRVHAHRAAHPAAAALAAAGAGRRRRGAVRRPLQPGVCGQLPRAGAAGGQRARLRRRTARRGPAAVRRQPAADADDDGIQLPPGAPGTLHSRTVPGAAPAAGRRRRRQASGRQG